VSGAAISTFGVASGSGNFTESAAREPSFTIVCEAMWVELLRDKNSVAGLILLLEAIMDEYL
jgi:hypothetical protein